MAAREVAGTQEYNALPGEESSEQYTPFEVRNQKSRSKIAQVAFKPLVVFTTILCAIVIALSIRLWFTPSPLHSAHGVSPHQFVDPVKGYDVQLTSDLNRRPCGRSPKEAVARGCFFDFIRIMWLPPLCADPELTEQYLKSVGDMPCYRDKAGTIPMTIQELPWVEEGEEVWVTIGYHKHHCAFAQLKLHRAIMAGAGIDTFLDVAHTAHCALWLMNTTRGWNEVAFVQIGSGFPDCKTLEEMRTFEKDMLKATMGGIGDAKEGWLKPAH